jgi:hypothetical protein
VLHEPMPTWAGRHAVTRDTKALAQLSLDLADQRHTVRCARLDCAVGFVVALHHGVLALIAR